MCGVTAEERHGEISDSDRDASVGENQSKVHPPVSVVLATLLYCAEFVSAAVLISMYHKSGDVIWMWFTLFFVVFPAVLTQLTLTFVHRDVGRDRPLVLLLHLLLLGPIIRCLEALILYCKAGKMEDSYVTITKRNFLKKGQRMEREIHIGQVERNLATHRDAFERTTVIQAFLGSTPQLTLQLYAAIQERYVLDGRLALMIISLISIIYGALVCNVLAIKIRYDDYKVRLRPVAYFCMIVWRGLEIATRVTALVLFSTALTHWVILVGLLNFFFFLLLPWVRLCCKKTSPTGDVEKNFSKLGTCIVLSLFTVLFACINIFCWSAVQLDLADNDLIEKKHNWLQLAMYYSGRFVENLLLITLWYFFKSDFYEYVCAPLLAVQLLICYSLAVLFMLLFYEFCHPFRSLFQHNIHNCLQCSCRQKSRRRQEATSHSYSTAPTLVRGSREHVELLMPLHPENSALRGDRPMAFDENTMEAA
ncbi:Membrane transport protein XK [Oryzias melastigma]|uniref:XK-related protein n=2 Tax=Oryzias melastigma TaxID=30732 RepID=A0A834CTH8_ORYME|nr:Membrane transport protein XK [Oryzias melastigma]